MEYNKRRKINPTQAAKAKIDDFLAEATASIEKARKVSDETGVSFSYSVGNKRSVYQPAPPKLVLTQAKALEILKNSDTLSSEMKDKIIDCLKGNDAVTYRESETWSGSYYGSSDGEDEGWISSF